VPVSVEIDAEGNVVAGPRRSPSYRVFPSGFPNSHRSDGVPISADGMHALKTSPEERRLFVAAATSFREFLRVWRFLDQETGQIRTLGHDLWPSQEEFVSAIEAHPWVFNLKARQLGITTLGIAFDAWVMRFRDPSARVHCFSSGDDAAKELLEHIASGFERLPPSFQLPMHRTARSITLDAGADEKLRAFSYASTRAASRGTTCTHLHLDEWSAMLFPGRVYQSVAPSVAPGGSFHILTTETVGPESESATYFRRCINGDGSHHALFVPALSRPGRDAAWLDSRRRSMPKADFQREYPQTWGEALESAGERMFSSEDLDACATDALPPFPDQASYEAEYFRICPPTNERERRKRRRYSAGVDIGLKHDATVLTIIDCTDSVMSLVYYERIVKPSTAEVQQAIERLHANWPSAHITIEDSGIGYPVRQGVNVRASQLHGLLTTGISKPRMLGALQLAIEQGYLLYDARELPQLDRELRAYSIPDSALVTDSVMSLAFAIAGAEHVHTASGDGRILGVMRV
jgi:hypothetical protein